MYNIVDYTTLEPLQDAW